MSIKMRVWGPLALFSRPELRVERCSYEVPTPSAARGMLDSVMYHPGMKWVVDRLYILKPIKFVNLRRNEVKSKILASDLRTAMTGGKKPLYIATKEDIQQRASMYLVDVEYVIEAHFDMLPTANPSDNPGKFQDMMKRRLRKGQCYSTPYLGTRECTAHFELWEGDEIPTIQESRDLGLMLFDLDYTDPADIKPIYFHAKMVNGVIDLTNCEVIR